MGKSYEHFSKGDTVRIERAWRSPVAGSNFSEWDDHDAKLEGEVVNMTNAGFRGLEYTVRTAEGLASGISAADLSLVEAVEIAAWPGQVTSRDGQSIGPR